MKASLINIVNRVYEVQLAKLELEALNCQHVQLNLDRTEFEFTTENLKQLLQRASWIKNIDSEETLINKVLNMHKGLLRRWLDNYWLHYAYPFKAKTRPLTARCLINIILPGGGLILDPFCGSGTINVEAKWLGIDTVGVDANPFYVYLSDVKCKFFDDTNLEEEIKNIAFLYSQTARRDMRTRKYMERLAEMEKSVKLWQQTKNGLPIGKHTIKQGDATELNLENESIDGVVTSPPYGTAIDYIAIDRGALKFFSTQQLKVKYLSTKNLKQYFPMLRKAYSEMDRVLKPHGKIAIIIGNQTRQGQIIDIVGWTKQQFIEKGYQLLHELSELLSSTNVFNILSDAILIFQKVG